jgi:hypothetical protein
LRARLRAGRAGSPRLRPLAPMLPERFRGLVRLPRRPRAPGPTARSDGSGRDTGPADEGDDRLDPMG